MLFSKIRGVPSRLPDIGYSFLPNSLILNTSLESGLPISWFPGAIKISNFIGTIVLNFFHFATEGTEKTSPVNTSVFNLDEFSRIKFSTLGDKKL